MPGGVLVKTESWGAVMAVVRVEITEPLNDLVLVRHRKPLAAAALSVVWPGLGHAYLGRTAAAVGLVLAQVLLVVLTVAPEVWRVTVPVWGLLVLASAVHAWREAARQERGRLDADSPQS